MRLVHGLIELCIVYIVDSVFGSTSNSAQLPFWCFESGNAWLPDSPSLVSGDAGHPPGPQAQACLREHRVPTVPSQAERDYSESAPFSPCLP
jgi:hypothetical protein